MKDSMQAFFIAIIVFAAIMLFGSSNADGAINGILLFISNNVLVVILLVMAAVLAGGKLNG